MKSEQVKFHLPAVAQGAELVSQVQHKGHEEAAAEQPLEIWRTMSYYCYYCCLQLLLTVH